MSTRKEQIKEIEKIIQDFAEKDLYSANCIEVKYLYKKLRQLKDQEYLDDNEEDYEPVFIGGSDVPICGHYE